MEIVGRYVQAVEWMVKLCRLELGQFHMCDPGDVWTRVIKVPNRTLNEQHRLLFLMDLRRLRSVSQYSSEFMILQRSRNSTNSVN
ncbi:hypothetical protein TNIN_1951 [Trichonephila inaurata madagascariensis]|uniref:Uncharacterized protein n=1 Tax=Trichonephila inaurata madagascariensis TaxID=2747483 RepID=A0A8X6MEX5_9ARAC|nr:hypothetical protein TNIN_1951 [Trichonephila inaurata madagascariensis]